MYYGIIHSLQRYYQNYQDTDPMTEEVKAICRVLNWQYHLFDDNLIKGLCFSPPECEPVFLTFLSNGLLYSPFGYNDDPDNPVISTKTQYARMEAHIAVIKLPACLKEKYFARFELTDEGYYWKTYDLAALQKQFDRYNPALDFLSRALSELPAKEMERFSGGRGSTKLIKVQRIFEPLTLKLRGRRQKRNTKDILRVTFCP